MLSSFVTPKQIIYLQALRSVLNLKRHHVHPHHAPDPDTLDLLCSLAQLAVQLATLTAELDMLRSKSSVDALSRGEAGVTAMKLADKVEALSQVIHA